VAATKSLGSIARKEAREAVGGQKQYLNASKDRLTGKELAQFTVKINAE
jgi:hypothetical protein